LELNRTHYTTQLQVRPDDLDMFRHVHSSRYMDYVLAARYEQMKHCYGFSMESFLEKNYGWVIRKSELNFHRALGLGDAFEVETWLVDLNGDTCEVGFEIRKLPNGKKVNQGAFWYTLVNLDTGRACKIPDWVIELYSLKSKV